LQVSVAGRRLRPIIVNDNGDHWLQVQSSRRENMQDHDLEHEAQPKIRAKSLPAAAARALAEAAERSKERAENAPEKEIGGRGGLDPARFGDWEAKGIAHDF
jgi:hypothetical protein